MSRKIIIFFMCIYIIGITVIISSGSSGNFSDNVMNFSTKNEGWISLEPVIGVGDKIVVKNGNGLHINFTAGLGENGADGSFGFQPHSTYNFEKIIKVTNITDKTLNIWITVHGAFKEHDWINIYSDNGWTKNTEEREDQITLKKNESFHISIDFINISSGIAIGEHSGSMILHAKLAESEPTQPKDNENETDKPDNNSPGTADVNILPLLIMLIASFAGTTAIITKNKKPGHN